MKIKKFEKYFTVKKRVGVPNYEMFKQENFI